MSTARDPRPDSISRSDPPPTRDATLIIEPTNVASAGSYRCIVANSSGSRTSDAATLSIVEAVGGGRIQGFSARTINLNHWQRLVVGFVVDGGSTPIKRKDAKLAKGTQSSRTGLRVSRSPLGRIGRDKDHEEGLGYL